MTKQENERVGASFKYLISATHCSHLWFSSDSDKEGPAVGPVCQMAEYNNCRARATLYQKNLTLYYRNLSF